MARNNIRLKLFCRLRRKRVITLPMLLLCLGLPWWAGLLPPECHSATLRAALAREPGSLDPHRTLEPAAWTYIFPCYQRLVALKGNTTEVEPSLAVTWRVSDDGRMYTFVLKQEVTFSDGRRLDADAVRLSFDRAMGLKVIKPIYFPTLMGIDVLGPYTLRFLLTKPTPYFLHALASPAASIVSPGYRAYPPDYLRSHTLGSGMYQLEHWEPGREIRLATRPDTNFKNRIDRFVVSFVSDPRLQTEMLYGGEVEIIGGAGPGEYEHLKEYRDLKLYSTAGFTSQSIVLNLRRSWLADSDVRRALALALDYEGLIHQLKGRAALRSNGPVPAGMEGKSTETDPYPYRPDEARRILAAHTPLPRPVHLLFGPGQTWPPLAAQIIAEQLEAVGISLDLMERSEPDFRQHVEQGDFDLALVLWRPPVAHPGYILDHWLNPSRLGPDRNAAYYENQEIGDLLEKAAQTENEDVRRDTYRRIQTIAHQDIPYIHLYQQSEQVGLSKQVEEFSLHPMWPEVFPLEKIKLK